MPRKAGEKFGRKSTQGPDGYDLSTLASDCLVQFGRGPRWELEQVEPLVFVIRCSLDCVAIGGNLVDFVDARRCNVTYENPLHIMLQVAHRCYHAADREILRAVEEADRTA